MFEGTGLIPNTKKSKFKPKYIDTNVAYDPVEIGGTTFFRERTKAAADAITKQQQATKTE